MLAAYSFVSWRKEKAITASYFKFTILGVLSQFLLPSSCTTGAYSRNVYLQIPRYVVPSGIGGIRYTTSIYSSQLAFCISLKSYILCRLLIRHASVGHLYLWASLSQQSLWIPPRNSSQVFSSLPGTTRWGNISLWLRTNYMNNLKITECIRRRFPPKEKNTTSLVNWHSHQYGCSRNHTLLWHWEPV